MLVSLAGCSDNNDDDEGTGVGSNGLVPLQDRHLQKFDVDGFFSRTLVAGPFEILDGVSVDVSFELPLTEGVEPVIFQASSNMGIFFPKIDGCNWSANELPDKCRVPVIVDAGPYYSATVGIPDLQTEGDTIATEPAQRLGQFLIENFVPYGYAVAQLSVLGTGDSTHCQDLMGYAEQQGIDAAVTWLGEAPWSNGNVALIGRSYDGSTPWQAAMFGNPHLATIVPISGLTGVHELMYHNGSAESRGAGVLYALYAAMTIDGEVGDALQVLCKDYLTGLPEGLVATTLGDPADGLDEYWSERYFLDRVLQNYEGSVYLIHGLQDWNVDPHMAFPAYNQLEEKGNDMKALLGQWGHMYPDRPSEHVSLDPGRGAEAYPESVRYDWAQDLLEWFDYYLKEGPLKPELRVEVQDNQGSWRVEPTWPPAAQIYDLNLADAEVTLEGPGIGGTAASTPWVSPVHSLEFRWPDIDASGARIAGLPHLALNVVPQGPGGQIYASLSDDKGLLLGHAILDLRYASGSKTAEVVVPGTPMQVRLEFEPMDVVLEPGRTLVLRLEGTGEDYLPSLVSTPVQVDVASGGIELPLIFPQEPQFFTPPAWSGKADATEPQP